VAASHSQRHAGGRLASAKIAAPSGAVRLAALSSRTGGSSARCVRALETWEAWQIELSRQTCSSSRIAVSGRIALLSCDGGSRAMAMLVLLVLLAVLASAEPTQVSCKDRAC
jgi:hypothetical protein